MWYTSTKNIIGPSKVFTTVGSQATKIELQNVWKEGYNEGYQGHIKKKLVMLVVGIENNL